MYLTSGSNEKRAVGEKWLPTESGSGNSLLGGTKIQTGKNEENIQKRGQGYGYFASDRLCFPEGAEEGFPQPDGS